MMQHQLPFDSVRFSEQTLGSLENMAQALKDRLTAKLEAATSLERRLLAALAKAASVADAVSAYAEWPDCWTLAMRLADRVSADPRLAPLRDVWAQLALFRGSFTVQLLKLVGADHLDHTARAILEDGLLQPCNGSVAMHDVLKPMPKELKWQTWHLRQSAHDSFAEYFRTRCDAVGASQFSPLEDAFEGFHHAASAGRPSASQDFAPIFNEQLHIQGRALSKQCGNHAAAASVFEEAIRRDNSDDYAHHYLAYNLDWLAADEDRSDHEYLRAIELNRKHPWWWSQDQFPDHHRTSFRRKAELDRFGRGPQTNNR